MTQAELLAQAQQALLRALLSEGGGDDVTLWPHLAHTEAQNALARRGLQAYQANGLALAERALTAAYPVLNQLLGADSFAPMARHFWRQHPPQRGDMAQWGATLADFIAQAPQLQEEPYLADVARLEWALHCAASAPDVLPNAASLALLTQAEAAPVTLSLGAGVFLLASHWPVASIVNAHKLGTPSLAQAAQMLQADNAEHALVSRQGYQPQVRAVSSAEFALVTALQCEHDLEHALNQALALDSQFDFGAWLTQAFSAGLVSAAIHCSTPLTTQTTDFSITKKRRPCEDQP